MFCVKCGNKMADSSAFCQLCGTKVNASEGITVSNQGSFSKEFDRGALKIYMRNVLALECIVHKISEQINTLDKKMKNLEKNNYYRLFDLQHSSGKFHFFYDGKNYKVKVAKWGGCVDSMFFGYESTVWISIDDVLSSLNDAHTWYSPTYLVSHKPSIRSDVSSIVRYNKEKNEKKKNFLQCWKEFKEAAPIEYEKNKKTLSELKLQYEALCIKYKQAKKILNNAYEINIVPGMFRNKLYAIYYLYDLVATSNMSFDMAILNCNLEEIKSKLDTVIAKQQESIINQARILAQNERLCAQNEQMLKNLAAVETNTRYASQYAEIAASNSETLVYLATH